MSDEAASRLRVETQGDATAVRFHDAMIFSEENVNAVGRELERLVEEGHRRVVLDFDGVQYLSSAALGKLITFKKRLGATGGEMRLSDIHPDLIEVFRITRLDTVFDIRETRAEAIGSFGS